MKSIRFMKSMMFRLAFFSLLISAASCESSPESNTKQAAIEKGDLFQKTSHKGNYPATITISGKGAMNYAGNSIGIFQVVGNNKNEAARFDVADDGSFEGKLKVDRPGFYSIGQGNQFVVVDHTDLDLIIDTNGQVKAKDSYENTMLKKFQEINGKLNEEGMAMQQQFAAAQDQEKAMADYQKFIEKAVGKLKGFISENKTPFVSILILNALDADQEHEFLMETVSTLQKKYPGVAEVEQMAAMLEASKKTAIGEVAPEIALQNPEGEIVKLSSLRGNYVLIDFWASWCGPCRKENPNVVRMYNKFKGKNFEIYGVSLDRQREKWLDAIEKDQLGWLHVSDLKFWQSEAAQAYNVSAIPMTFLIDPEGKIVAKNLRGRQLEQKLEELL